MQHCYRYLWGSSWASGGCCSGVGGLKVLQVVSLRELRGLEVLQVVELAELRGLKALRRVHPEDVGQPTEPKRGGRWR